MIQCKCPQRPGSSLLEIVMFISFFAIASSAVLVLLFGTGEQRKRQEGIALVDQSGIQLLQTITRRIRAGERILDPPVGGSGSVLALQMAASGDDPTILAVHSGALVAAEYASVSPLSSSGDVLVHDLRFRNTSAEYNRPSVWFSFTLTRNLGLPSMPSYSRTFETLVTLFPDDNEQGGGCGCTQPACTAGYYRWEYCAVDTCSDGPVVIPCS